jgi:hypothetical protein
MIVMLCRNRVSDFSKWKGVFDSHSQAHRDAGLHLKNVWRRVKEPNNVFFLLEVMDLKKAREFTSNAAGWKPERLQVFSTESITFLRAARY